MEVDRAGLGLRERTELQVQILEAALAVVNDQGPQPTSMVAGVALSELNVRAALESAYRRAARLTDDRGERIELVDRANAVRPRTLT